MLKKRIAVGLLPYLTILSLFILAIIGWVMNVVKFFGMLDGGITAMFVARIVGFFAVPLGCILGWF